MFSAARQQINHQIPPKSCLAVIHADRSPQTPHIIMRTAAIASGSYWDSADNFLLTDPLEQFGRGVCRGPAVVSDMFK